MSPRVILAVAGIAFSWSASARADGPVPASQPSLVLPPTVDTYDLGETLVVAQSPRTTTTHEIIMPEGWEAGGELTFLTSDGGLANKPLDFTDLAFFRLNGRVSAGDNLELAASVTLLPKQPSYTDEPIYQGAALGLRLGFCNNFAFDLGGKEGPLLGGDGWWSGLTTGVEAKTSVDQTLDFAGGLEASMTVLDPSGTAEGFWLAEAIVHAETQLKVPNGMFAGVVGVSYALPFAHRSASEYDPQPRLDFHVGVIYAVVPDWDLYADYAFIDRGDLSNPATTLPILDGGFDQRQLTLGIIHRPSDDNGRRRSNSYGY